MARKNLRWLSAVLMVMLVFTMLFSGCQKDNETTPEQTAQATQQPGSNEAENTAEPEDLKPVKLIWYMLNTPQKDPQPVYDAANKIIQEKINATVDFRTEDYGTMEEKMKMIIASGEEFDICWTAQWLNKFEPNVDKGAYLELDELIDEYAPKTKESIPESIWDLTKVNGKLYGIPNYQIMAAQTGLAINKSLVEQYDLGDISNIKKYEDFEPLLVACKEKAPGIFPLGAVNNHGMWPQDSGYEPVPGIPVGLNIDKDNKVFVPFGIYNETVKARQDLNRKWIEAGLVMDLINQKNLTALANAGKVLVLYSQVKPGGDAERKMQSGFDWVTIPTQEARIDRPTALNTLQSLSVTSKNPERAMMLLELVNTDKELYNLLVFGIEGTHYNKVSENRIEPIADSGYQGLAWAIGNQFNAYLVPGQDDDVWEQTIELNNSAKPYRASKFVLDRTNIADEIKALQAVDGTYKNIIYSTEVDLDKMEEEQMQKRKEAGMTKYMEEVQKQLDEYFANN